MDTTTPVTCRQLYPEYGVRGGKAGYRIGIGLKTRNISQKRISSLPGTTAGIREDDTELVLGVTPRIQTLNGSLVEYRCVEVITENKLYWIGFSFSGRSHTFI